MTCQPTTTITVANKDAEIYTPTPVSKLCSALIGRLALAIERERDVETIDRSNLDDNAWLKDVEAAWTDVSDIQLALMGAPALRDEDMPLKVLAFVINKRMEAETEAEVLRLEKFLQRKSHWLTCPGQGATARRVTSMLVQGRSCLEAINSLDLFQPFDDAFEDAVDGPDLTFEA